jgi:hypothetical protein
LPLGNLRANHARGSSSESRRRLGTGLLPRHDLHRWPETFADDSGDRIEGFESVDQNLSLPAPELLKMGPTILQLEKPMCPSKSATLSWLSFTMWTFSVVSSCPPNGHIPKWCSLENVTNG